MTTNGWIQITVFLLVVLALTKPLGAFMTRVFNREQTPHTTFAHQGSLKLAVQCRGGQTYANYLLEEDLIYRAYNLLTDRSFRVRLARVSYGLLAMGWRGSARHWYRYEIASLLLAGLATPLVVSVHSVVSLDFAVAIVPGWHSTIFPP